MSLGKEARDFVRVHRVGVLSTHSASVPGYPFGSVVPYVLDHAARPVVLLSALAEHTRSLLGDPRASLIVHEFSADDQSGPRLTVAADAERFSDAVVAERYLRYLPEARRFLGFGDFAFWRLAVRRALFVRGFGRIEWIEAVDLAPPENRLGEIESEIIAHMNADHRDTLRLYGKRFYDVDAEDASMVGIDCDGFDVRAAGRLLRFAFDAPVTNAGTARQALASLAEAARRV